MSDFAFDRSDVPPVLKAITGIPLRWDYGCRDPLSCHKDKSTIDTFFKACLYLGSR